MIHLITVSGKSARDFFLAPNYQSDFKALMRTVTSGRVFMVSTKFRSDLFYNSRSAKNDEILKLWALYVNADLQAIDKNDLSTTIGAEKSLSSYFHSINRLSNHWYQYGIYQKAFQDIFSLDQENPVTRTVVGCDQFLIGQPEITRAPLINPAETSHTRFTKNTFSLAMHIIRSENHSN